jgi:hypothetical protein
MINLKNAPFQECFTGCRRKILSKKDFEKKELRRIEILIMLEYKGLTISGFLIKGRVQFFIMFSPEKID